MTAWETCKPHECDPCGGVGAGLKIWLLQSLYTVIILNLKLSRQREWHFFTFKCFVEMPFGKFHCGSLQLSFLCLDIVLLRFFLVDLYSFCRVKSPTIQSSRRKLKQRILYPRQERIMIGWAQTSEELWLVGRLRLIEPIKERSNCFLTLSLPESILESINVAHKSVDETLLCDHSNESYWAVLTFMSYCLLCWTRWF